jgi:hypothetical protein
MTTEADVEVTMLLCDAAQEMGGKLYILGGGWSRVVKNLPQVNMALAIKILIPWHQANEPMDFRAALVTEDGQPVMVQGGDPTSESRQPIQVTGKIEVGRPPGLKAGTPLDQSLVINVQAPLMAGRYRWEVWIRGALRAATAFEVLDPASLPVGHFLRG